LIFKFVSEEISTKGKKYNKSEISGGRFNLDELYTTKLLKGEFKVDLHASIVETKKRKGKKDK